MLNAALVPHQQVAGAVAVRADVFPAAVTFSFAENNYSRARAILTAEEVLVLVDGGTGSGPAVLYQQRLEDVQTSRQQVVATTVDGDVTITRAGGCGCGSRLRSYQPFQRAVRMERISA
jgi:hypothetical protein